MVLQYFPSLPMLMQGTICRPFVRRFLSSNNSSLWVSSGWNFFSRVLSIFLKKISRLKRNIYFYDIEILKFKKKCCKINIVTNHINLVLGTNDSK